MTEGSDPKSIDLRRCRVPQAALEFVCACSPTHGLLVADWLVSAPGGTQQAAGASQRLPTAFRAAVDGALRQRVGCAPLVLPFDPLDFLRDPRNWRAPAEVPPGTPHARKVWQALCQIPVGETRTYGEIARDIGSSPRAVGQACRANPWPLFIPCHRAVPASGSRGGTGGYAGQRQGPLADIKGWLLDHERTGPRQESIAG
jgi:methylated-DNA-[protein]-cysteine S-methyltransferase